MPNDITFSDEQLDIRDAVENTHDNLLIDARAGSGKTSTIIGALEVIPAATTLVCAFNKRIAEEMVQRLPPLPPTRGVVVKTLHALGLAILKFHHPHLEVDDECTEQLVQQAASMILEATGSGTFSMKMRRSAVRLLTTLKETQIEPKLDGKQIRAVGLDFDIFGALDVPEIDFVVQAVGIAYTNSLDFKRRRTIAFSDMVWGPVVAKLAPRGRFKAVCVDEAQDVSAPQFELVQKLIAPGGRLIVVGDPHQAIYSWRGAIGDVVWQQMDEKFKARHLSLTITWRCPATVVQAAKELVPDFKARPGAPKGEVRSLQFEKLAAELKQISAAQLGKGRSTFVLSRINAELLRSALELWKQGVHFSLNGGREIIEPLFWVIEKLDLSSKETFLASAKRWHEAEMKKAETAESSAWADRVESQYTMLLVALDYAVVPTRVAQLLRDVLGSERRTSITLSTVHKVKGLEADRVYLIRETFERHKKGKPCRGCQGSGERYGKSCYSCGGSGEWRPPVPQEELNIEYVAITRARETLTWVELPENPLTVILRRRMMEEVEQIVDDAAFEALDHVPDDDEKNQLVAEHLYGKDARVMLDGRVSQPGDDGTHRIVTPKLR